MIRLKQGINGNGLKKILGIKTPIIKKSKKTKDYSNPKWKSLRVKVFKRDKYICLKCGSKEKLCCHHTYYINGNELWEYPLNCFQTLCNDCHNEFHKKTPGRDLVRKYGSKTKLKLKKPKTVTKHIKLKRKENKFLSKFKV